MSSLLSISGAQAQKRSALPLQSSGSAIDPSAAAPQTDGSEPPNPHVSIFQLMLGFMLSPKTAAPLHEQAAGVVGSSSAAEEQAEGTALILPFPLQTEEIDVPQDDSIAGAGGPASLYLMQALPQLPEAQPEVQPHARMSEVTQALPGMMKPAGDGESGAENVPDTTDAAGDAVPAVQQSAPGSSTIQDGVRAQSAALSAGAGTALSSGNAIASALCEAPVASAANQNAPAAVHANSAIALTGEHAAPAAPHASTEAAADPFGRNGALRASAAPHAAAETMDAKYARPAEANRADAAASSPVLPARDSAPSGEAPMAPAVETAHKSELGGRSTTNVAAGTMAASNDPSLPQRTPGIFMRLHDAAVRSGEPMLPKNAVKPAGAQTLRAEPKPADGERAAVHAQPAAVADEEAPAAVARMDAVKSEDQSVAKVQTMTAHEAAPNAQHAPAELHTIRMDGALQRADGAAVDLQTRAAGAPHEAPSSSTTLSPRVREDVFESVFREVSAIRHTPASVDVTLSPESLGKVTVNVGMEEGRMSARINVQNADVRQVIEANMPRLQDALRASGLALDSIAVFVDSGSAFSERRNDAPRRKMNAAGFADDGSVETMSAPGDTKQYGYSTVEYIM